MRKMHRFRSSRACANYDPNLCHPFIRSVVFNDSSRERRPWSYFADTQADQGLRCPHVPEDTFSHGAAHNPKTRLYKYIENFTSKNWKISDKNLIFFHISAQNIDCGYSLEPPRRGGSNEYHNLCFWAEIRKIMYTPVNPSFTIQKRGLRGSKLYRRVFVMIWQCFKLLIWIMQDKCKIVEVLTEGWQTMALNKINIYDKYLILILLNPDIPCLCKQCRSSSEGANWSGSALFTISIWYCIKRNLG